MKITLRMIVYARKRLEEIHWMYFANPIAEPKIFLILKQITTDLCGLILGLCDLGLEKIQLSLTRGKIKPSC